MKGSKKLIKGSMMKIFIHDLLPSVSYWKMSFELIILKNFMDAMLKYKHGKTKFTK